MNHGLAYMFDDDFMMIHDLWRVMLGCQNRLFRKSFWDQPGTFWGGFCVTVCRSDGVPGRFWGLFFRPFSNGRKRPETAKSGRNRPKTGRNRPEPTETGRNRPKPTETGRNRPTLGEVFRSITCFRWAVLITTGLVGTRNKIV